MKTQRLAAALSAGLFLILFFIPTVFAYDDGFIAWWPLDDGGTCENDATLSLTTYSGVTNMTMQNGMDGAFLDGINADDIQINDNNKLDLGTAPYTMGCWYQNVGNADGNNPLITKNGVAGAGKWGFQLGTGGDMNFFEDATNVQHSTYPIGDNVSHLVVVIRTAGNTGELWQDGINVANATFNADMNNSNELRIGARGDAANQEWWGIIANCFMYRVDRTANNASWVTWLNNTCTGTSACFGEAVAGPGAPEIIDINQTLNESDYNVTFTILSNNTNLSLAYLNTTTENISAYNLNASIPLIWVEKFSNGSKYTASIHVHEIGYGNFTLSLFNSTGDQITYTGGEEDLNQNLTTPIIVKIEDSVTGSDIGSTNFTFMNHNQSTGQPVPEIHTTNSTGEVIITYFKVGNGTSISVSTSGISGFFDGAETNTITKYPPTQKIIFELEAIGSSSQVILIFNDLLTYQPISGIVVNTTSGHGSGITDFFGKISFIGVVGETIEAQAVHNDYNNKNLSVEVFTRTETVYMTRTSITSNESIICRFLPDEQYIDRAFDQYIFIECENWQQIRNISIAISPEIEVLNLWEDFTVNSSGELDVFNFDFMGDLSWCNASSLCTGDSTTIKWRPTTKTLNSYGQHVVAGANIYDKADNIQEFRRAGFFIVAASKISNFFAQFSPEQRAWAGLMLAYGGTFIFAVALNMTFFMAGVLSIFFIVLNIVLGLWTVGLALIPLVVGFLVIAKGALS